MPGENAKGAGVALFVVGLIGGVLIGVKVTHDITTLCWQRDCVLRDAAQYSPETGVWEWTIPLKKGK